MTCPEKETPPPTIDTNVTKDDWEDFWQPELPYDWDDL